MKRKEILEIFNKIQLQLEDYQRIFESKNKNLIRLLKFREKFLIKGLALLLKKFFNLNIIKRVSLFYGRKIEVYLADDDASALYFLGCLYGSEAFVTNFLLDNLKEDDIFYDVGANYGFYTLLAQEIINEGEIHSFEPHPEIFKLLKRNCQLDIYQNTFLNQKALSDQTGEVWFYDHFKKKRHSGRGSLVVTSENSQKIKVNSIKLDDYLKNHKPPTLMKIDIEGGEYLLLKGAQKTLSSIRPKIIMEIFPDDHHRKAVQLLLDSGYKMYSLDKGGQTNFLESKIIQLFLEGKEKLEGNFYFQYG